MEKNYLYSITSLLLIVLVILFFILIRDQTSARTAVYVSVFVIFCAVFILWNYDSKLVKESKEKDEQTSKGHICFELSKSIANTKITYIVKYNDGNGDQIVMGTLDHVADVIKNVGRYRPYRMRVTMISTESMHSVDAFAESIFFTHAEMDKLNFLIETNV